MHVSVSVQISCLFCINVFFFSTLSNVHKILSRKSKCSIACLWFMMPSNIFLLTIDIDSFFIYCSFIFSVFSKHSFYSFKCINITGICSGDIALVWKFHLTILNIWNEDHDRGMHDSHKTSVTLPGNLSMINLILCLIARLNIQRQVTLKWVMRCSTEVNILGFQRNVMALLSCQ